MRRFLLLLLLASLVLPAAADAAWRAPCTPGAPDGPTCTWWSAEVTFVADGDTVRATIAGAGSRLVRLTGINAPELRVYSRSPGRRRGDCHAVSSTRLIEKPIKRAKGSVRLSAQRAGSVSGRRLRRSVWVRSGGRWTDLSALSLERGGSLWLPNGAEYARNRVHATLAGGSAAARRGIYDPDACRRGPDDDVPLRITANWDADSNDERNLNGEWVDVRNLGSRPLDLSGWFVRDSSLRRGGGPPTRRRPGRVFPSGTVVPPGRAVRVRIGCGSDTVLEQHWCQDGSVFENVTDRPRNLGDGAYLFDPDGDLRASFIYPCLTGCTDPAAGRVRLVAQPRRPEAMSVVNISDAPVDLTGHVLKYRTRGRARSYVFSKDLDTVLEPGRSVRWTPESDRFADGGGVVELRTLDDVLTDCVSWGFGRC